MAAGDAGAGRVESGQRKTSVWQRGWNEEGGDSYRLSFAPCVGVKARRGADGCCISWWSSSNSIQKG